jgi:O-succinylbenzoic acid--CoA ligase
VLRAVPASADALLPALAAALDGTGPAVLPVPTDPVAAARVLAALRPGEPLEADDVALVVPTSGSAGEPKGVLLTAGNLRASATATATRLGRHGSWLLAIPPTHVGGLQVLVRSLLAGTEPVVLPPGPFSAAAFAEATAALTGGPRFVSLVPTQLRRLLGAADLAALRSYDAVLLGGAAAAPALLAGARAAGVRVVTTFGMSETSGGCVYDGVPLEGVRVDLHDGRVRLAGPVVARGYRLRPDLTRAVFQGDTFSTGDLGRLEGGVLHVLGRADDVVVTGGEKVPPAAVEAALETHPSVVEAAVTGVPDPEWGARVVAHVVLRDRLTLAQARDHVAASLPRTWAPRELRELAALPLLASGKVDRAALP